MVPLDWHSYLSVTVFAFVLPVLYGIEITSMLLDDKPVTFRFFLETLFLLKSYLNILLEF